MFAFLCVEWNKVNNKMGEQCVNSICANVKMDR